MTEETTKQLWERHNLVKAKVEGAEESYRRAKVGAGRTKKAQWAGCLRFTLLGIETELRARGEIE